MTRVFLLANVLGMLLIIISLLSTVTSKTTTTKKPTITTKHPINQHDDAKHVPVWPTDDPLIHDTSKSSTPKPKPTSTKAPKVKKTTPSKKSTTTAESTNDSTNKIIIAVCVTVGIIIILIIIGVILCCVFREKISNMIFAAEMGDSQGAPGSVYYSPNQFNHKGALQIKKQAPVDVKAVYQDDKDTNPANAHFQFTEDQNEVFDIGSEVEQVV